MKAMDYCSNIPGRRGDNTDIIVWTRRMRPISKLFANG